MLSSDMVLNGLVSLKFSSLGIQMPSAHLHWLVTLPLCHITLRIFQSCWTESWTAFVHAVRYPSWSRGNGWSCCLNDFLDLFQAWILDVQLSCFFWLSTCSLAGITQGVAKEGVNITRPDLPLLLSPSNFLASQRDWHWRIFASWPFPSLNFGAILFYVGHEHFPEVFLQLYLWLASLFTDYLVLFLESSSLLPQLYFLL